MPVRQYIGARYVTKIYENSNDPSSAEWEASVNYEPLTMVTYNNGSYLSKKEVPASIGNPAANPTYWVQTGFYNGQIANLQDQINEFKDTIVTPEMFGAKGDGLTDDTQAIQNAVDSGKTVIFTPNKTYLVSVDGIGENAAITLHSNNVLCGNNAKIKLAANSDNKYRILYCYNVDNVKIDGFLIEGDRDSHTGITGQQGYGISIVGSRNINVTNCIITKCWGDGINISATYAPLADSIMSKDVFIDNVDCSYNRRQGISVEGCDGLKLVNCHLHHISGVSPEYGIDFEPSAYIDPDTLVESNFEYIDNVFVNNLKCDNNTGGSIIIQDGASTQQGNYIFNDVICDFIRIKSEVENIAFGINTLFTNVLFNPDSSGYAINYSLRNNKSTITFDGVEILDNTNPPLISDRIMLGKFNINNVVIHGHRGRLISNSEPDADALNGFVATNINAIDGLGYPTNNAAASAFRKSKVSINPPIIEYNKEGYVAPDEYANMYIYKDITQNSSLVLPWISDGFEIEIIYVNPNGAAYYVDLVKGGANYPKIYSDTLGEISGIRITNGSIKLKFDETLGGYVPISIIGSHSYS